MTELEPYVKVDVDIGKTSIQARPIEWDEEPIDGQGHGKDGSYINPTIYETVCPHCSQMVHYKAGLKSVKCPECGKGEDLAQLEQFDDPFCEPGDNDDMMVFD